MNQAFHDPSIDPQLGARLVALVLGEASDFERDELNRLIAERPDLARYRDEIQQVHDLLDVVGKGEMSPPEGEWRLAARKRAQLLRVLSGEATVEPSKARAALSHGKTPHRPFWRNRILMGVASAAAVLFVVTFYAQVQVRVAREAARVARATSAPLGAAVERWDEYAADASASDTTRGEIAQATNEIDRLASSTKYYQSTLGEIRETIGAAQGSLSTSTDTEGSSSVRYRVPAARTTVDFSKKQAELPSPPTLTAPSVEGQSSSLGEAVVPTKPAESGGGAAERFGRDGNRGASVIDGRADVTLEGRDARSARPSLGTTVEFAEPSAEPKSEEFDVSNARDPASVPDSSEPWRGFAGGGLGGMGGGGAVPGGSSVSTSQPSGQPSGQPTAEKAPTTGPANGPVTADGAVTFDVPAQAGAREESAPQDTFYDKELAESDELNQLPNAFGESRAVEHERQRRAGQAPVDSSLNGLADESTVELPLAGFAITPDGRSGGVAVGKAKDAMDLWDRPVGEPGDRVEDLRKGLGIAPAGGLRNGVFAGDALQDAVPSADSSTDGDVWLRFDANGRVSDAQSARDQKLQSELEGTDLDLGYSAGEAKHHLYSMSIANASNRATEMGQVERAKSLALLRQSLDGLEEINAGDDAFSTFSLHVSDVSFKLARTSLMAGQWPEASTVRVEEFVNAFDYGDPLPQRDEKVSCTLEQSLHPFLQQRNVLRVSMRTGAAGRSSSVPLRLTFLLDNSGSMERPDRQQTVRRAFAALAGQLTPIDQVTLIAFSRQPRLMADNVSGVKAGELVRLIESLPSEGGTNIEAALQLAIEKAHEQRVEGAQNRVILLTDGAVNLGNANPESLSQMVTMMRDQGIAFDAAGICAEGLNDEILEALARKGDGRYYLLDSAEAVDEGFARQIAGALNPSAKNVKVQVEFNPKRVGRYKLLGFEKHRLATEDFRNDQVDAAEMAAAEAGVAVYQFEPLPDGSGDVGSVSVRFRDLETGQMIENRWPIPYQPDAPRLDQASPSLRIATTAAMLAAKLRAEPLGDVVELKTLAELTAGLPTQKRSVSRVQELEQMIQQARQISGN